MAASGALQKLAQAVGEKLTRAFQRAWTWLSKLPQKWRAFRKAIEPVTSAIGWLADKFGGANVAMAAIAGTIAVMVIPAIYATVTAIYAMGAALLTTPIGWAIGLLAALAAGAVYVYRHWEPISRWLGDNLFAPFFNALNAVRSFFSKTWDSITTTFGDAIDWMSKAWDQYNPIALIRKGIDSIMAWLSNWNLGEVIRDKVAAIASYLPNWLKKKLGIADIAAAAPAAGAAAVGAAAAGQGVAAAKNGAVRVQVDFNNTPKGTKVSTEQRGSADFELNQGYAMVGA
jgi:hypothetical protein